MASLFRPFQNSWNFMRRMSHEQPVIYWSCILGGIGPLLVVAVPPIRKSVFGYSPAEAPPQSYPLPNRPRRSVQGYDDE
ncbi:N19M, NADH-ubiquinone oxidoreductase 9.5 kDa subunit [Dendrothele bispora CBS 962.96]|uniref:N19M, NADH-ubiquinone oxidoreductase 9.5 kDa subunit n=1 Tax=Dendrothele bispora (strain CBS 962.96) TaxID=1314807 RepID=A0A4S8MWM8_DENBC|nr:N19M, NADH-ubiquinone oxidoreductase 9.5 kDa subunit [Dendrothele bispora CBS 962.96]